MSVAVLDTIRQRLVSLKMPCALEELDTVVRQLEAGQISALEAIEALLSVELSFREARRIKVALGTSKLMPPKTLESFDFAFQPSLDLGSHLRTGGTGLCRTWRNRASARPARHR